MGPVKKDEDTMSWTWEQEGLGLFRQADGCLEFHQYPDDRDQDIVHVCREDVVEFMYALAMFVRLTDGMLLTRERTGKEFHEIIADTQRHTRHEAEPQG